MKKRVIYVAIIFLICVLHNNTFSQRINGSSNIVKGTLSNGMTYYIKKNDKPVDEVQFRLIIKAGSILEDEDQRGFAHFLEHMAFNGSEHFPGNSLIDYFQSIGVQFGHDINAYTGYDETVYMLPVPNTEKETLDKAFYFFGDILGGLLTLSKKDIDEERGVIHEEWRTTTGLNDRMRQEMYPLLYFNSRYKDRLPIGLMDEVVLKEGNEEALRRFYKDWYRPNLATLLVVGDVDVVEIEQRIKDTFETINNPVKTKERVYYGVNNHDNTLIKRINDKEITSTTIRIINKIPKRKEQTLNAFKIKVANILYTYMINERLEEKSNIKDAPFMFASSYISEGSGDKDRYISTASVKEGSIIEGIKGLMNELYRVKKYGFTQGEFERKRAILAKDIQTEGLEKNTLKSAQLMEQLMEQVLSNQECITSDLRHELFVKAINTISKEDVEKLANQYINNKNANRVIFVSAPTSVNIPSNEKIKFALDNVDYDSLEPYSAEELSGPLIEKEPQIGRLLITSTDEILGTTTLTYENGAEVVIKPTLLKNNEIQFMGSREGGYSRASDEQFNNASLSASLVQLGGLGRYNKQQVERLIGDKNASVSVNINRFSETIGGKSTVEDFETMMQLIYLKFTAPRKDKDQFDRFILNKKEYNKNRLNNPNKYFADVINKTLYNHHPRVATLLSQEEIEALSLDDAYEFYVSRFRSVRGMRFVFVGNINLKTFQPLIDKYIGGLPGDKIPNKCIDRGLKVLNKKISTEVARGKSEKSKVVIRFQGKYANGQLNRIKMQLLSDLMTIRLTKKLREELGGTYSPFAYSKVLDKPFNQYQFSIIFTCDPNQASALQKVALQIVDDLKKEVELEDLEKVKKATIKNRERALARNNYWVDLLLSDKRKLTTNYLKYNKQVEVVSQKSIMRLAKKYLDIQKVKIFLLSPEV
ncbi:insulinase family protein (plasmid) [Flammeovirga sp. MY04]|uniref:M16 family metallopeptidase n=1 Tax=Flammeovirga sp. MY04 TaxID=1191459 RepID=UPI00082411E0|nr:M16 family metallopeptidase [Flammeovirga sp. MY04]ANQ52878.2 insulinase family protein [Flammeovirga sp. MY04]